MLQLQQGTLPYPHSQLTGHVPVAAPASSGRACTGTPGAHRTPNCAFDTSTSARSRKPMPAPDTSLAPPVVRGGNHSVLRHSARSHLKPPRHGGRCRHRIHRCAPLPQSNQTFHPGTTAYPIPPNHSYILGGTQQVRHTTGNHHYPPDTLRRPSKAPLHVLPSGPTPNTETLNPQPQCARR